MSGLTVIGAVSALLLAFFADGVVAGGRDDRPCFRNEIEASAILSESLAAFQRDIQGTECDNKKIFKVYKKFVSRDVNFKIFGEDLPPPPAGPGPITDVDGLNAAFIETGVVAGICSTTFISWTAFNVTITEPGRKFTWRGNEVFVPPDMNPFAPPPGRIYEVSMDSRCRTKISSIDAVAPFPIGAACGE